MRGSRWLGCRLHADPGRNLPGDRIAPLIQAIGEAAFHAIAMRGTVLLVHADGIHFAARRAHSPGDEALDRLLGRLVHAACSSVRPLWRSRASTDGSRPRKPTNSSMGSRLPPRARILSRKDWPVLALKMPSSSKREKASADSTSAHL